MSNFIQDIIQKVKDNKIVAGPSQVFFFRKGAPIDPTKESEVVAERYARFLENEYSNEYMSRYITREVALKQIVQIVKEEISLGYSIYTDSAIIELIDLKKAEEKMKEIEKSEDFFDWVIV